MVIQLTRTYNLRTRTIRPKKIYIGETDYNNSHKNNVNADLIHFIDKCDHFVYLESAACNTTRSLLKNGKKINSLTAITADTEASNKIIQTYPNLKVENCMISQYINQIEIKPKSFIWFDYCSQWFGRKYSNCIYRKPEEINPNECCPMCDIEQTIKKCSDTFISNDFIICGITVSNSKMYPTSRPDIIRKNLLNHGVTYPYPSRDNYMQLMVTDLAKKYNLNSKIKYEWSNYGRKSMKTVIFKISKK